MWDYLKLYREKGLNMNEYDHFEFEKRSENFRREFLGEQEQRYYLEVLNPVKYYILARNKYMAHKMLEKTGICKTPLYCFYQPDGKMLSEEEIAGNVEGVMNILRAKKVTTCVIKTTESSHGDHVMVVQRMEYGIDDVLLTLHDESQVKLSDVLGSVPLVFEGVIQQTQQFAEFNPTSVNTVRFMTALYPDGKAYIVATFIKIGRAGRCVDNAGAGGNVDVCVDPDSGTLQYAIRYDGWRQIAEIDRHPDSGTPLNGVVIDHWEEICHQVLTFQQAFPYIKVAGWDIAITDDGPVVIEVNDMWDRTGQYFIRRGWRSDIRQCYFSWMSYYRAHPECYPVMGRLNQRLSNHHLQRITQTNTVHY